MGLFGRCSGMSKSKVLLLLWLFAPSGSRLIGCSGIRSHHSTACFLRTDSGLEPAGFGVPSGEGGEGGITAHLSVSSSGGRVSEKKALGRPAAVSSLRGGVLIRVAS